MSQSYHDNHHQIMLHFKPSKIEITYYERPPFIGRSFDRHSSELYNRREEIQN